ncbi:MAG: single-stranded DNA-binding protein [Actinobacteria bacterium]|nr:single-stranded DNA-binding protein [Actinomycetota bacterium]
MAIRTQESLSGFIASDPQLTHTTKGVPRFYARIGQEHYHKEPDGSFIQIDTTFHNLVMFSRSAERAAEQFAKGDNFVAEGYVRPVEYEKDGQNVQDEEFVARKIGHDLARTRYEVNRTRATGVEPAAEEPTRKWRHRDQSAELASETPSTPSAGIGM